MKFSTTAILLLTSTFILALTLVYASNASFKFYEDLRKEHTILIKILRRSDPLIIDEKIISRITIPDPGWIKVITEGGHPKEYRYYHNKELIAIDHLDEGSRLIRRDLIHKEHTRVHLFFDIKGDLTKAEWIDEKGKIVNSSVIFIPLPNIRSGY